MAAPDVGLGGTDTTKLIGVGAALNAGDGPGVAQPASNAQNRAATNVLIAT
jgi:hypothetical protein